MVASLAAPPAAGSADEPPGDSSLQCSRTPPPQSALPSPGAAGSGLRPDFDPDLGAGLLGRDGSLEAFREKEKQELRLGGQGPFRGDSNEECLSDGPVGFGGAGGSASSTAVDSPPIGGREGRLKGAAAAARAGVGAQFAATSPAPPSKRTPVHFMYLFYNPASGGNAAQTLCSPALKEAELWYGRDCVRLRLFNIVEGPSGAKPGFASLAKLTEVLHGQLQRVRGSGRQYPLVRVIAAGGDGTVMWCIAEMRKHGVRLDYVAVGVLPFGTGNDFARALGWDGNRATQEISSAGAHTAVAQVRAVLRSAIHSWIRCAVVWHDLWDVRVEVRSGGDFKQINSATRQKITLMNNKKKAGRVKGGANAQKECAAPLTAEAAAPEAAAARTASASTSACASASASPAKSASFRLSNYFSIGVESRIGVGFDRYRTSSAFLNRLRYAAEGVKKSLRRTRKINEIVSHMTTGASARRARGGHPYARAAAFNAQEVFHCPPQRDNLRGDMLAADLARLKRGNSRGAAGGLGSPHRLQCPSSGPRALRPNLSLGFDPAVPPPLAADLRKSCSQTVPPAAERAAPRQLQRGTIAAGDCRGEGLAASVVLQLPTRAGGADGGAAGGAGGGSGFFSAGPAAGAAGSAGEPATGAAGSATGPAAGAARPAVSPLFAASSMGSSSCSGEPLPSLTVTNAESGRAAAPWAFSPHGPPKAASETRYRAESAQFYPSFSSSLQFDPDFEDELNSVGLSRYPESGCFEPVKSGSSSRLFDSRRSEASRQWSGGEAGGAGVGEAVAGGAGRAGGAGTAELGSGRAGAGEAGAGEAGPARPGPGGAGPGAAFTSPGFAGAGPGFAGADGSVSSGTDRPVPPPRRTAADDDSAIFSSSASDEESGSSGSASDRVAASPGLLRAPSRLMTFSRAPSAAPQRSLGVLATRQSPLLLTAASLIAVNIPSFAAGMDVWSGAKEVGVVCRNWPQKRREELLRHPQRMGDGQLEFVTFPSVVSMGAERFLRGAGHGKRLHHSHGPFVLHFKTIPKDWRVYFQVDGEFFQVTRPRRATVTFDCAIRVLAHPHSPHAGAYRRAPKFAELPADGPAAAAPPSGADSGSTLAHSANSVESAQ